MDISFWTVAGVVTVMYYTGMTIAFGVLARHARRGGAASALPSLFDVADSAPRARIDSSLNAAVLEVAFSRSIAVDSNVRSIGV